MRRRGPGLRAKVMLIAAGVVLAAIGASVLTSSYYYGQAQARVQVARAQAIAEGVAGQMQRILSLGLEVADIRGFEEQADEAVRSNAGLAFVAVVNENAQVLFHSDALRPDAQFEFRAVAGAIRDGRHEAADREAGLQFGITPVRNGGGRAPAWIVVAVPQSALDSARYSMLARSLGVGALALLAGMAVLFFALSRYVTEPVSRFVDAIERIRRGQQDYSVSLPATGHDELATLVRGFNALLERTAQRERDLVAARDAAEAANRTKSEFLAMMSHEIRTPMNAVLGMAELLRMTRLDERQAAYLDHVQTGGRALLAIINDILELSRVEAGKVELRTAPFALHEVLRETIGLFGPAAETRGLALELQIGDVPEAVLGDAGRLRQILFNLIGNALKFTERGGVTVAVTSLEQGLRFAVSDTGMGIPPAFMERIFSPFAQADAGLNRRHGGTGLGLAIVKRLCDAMGGSIDVCSVPDEGTTFTIELPLPPARADAATLPAAQKPAASPSRRASLAAT